ncbi:MAG: hypothetical protein ACR2OO_13980 [Thermomicrobiales bacterium]
MPTFSDAAVVAVVLGLVEVAKRAGLPTRYAGLAAILFATLCVALRDLAGGDGFHLAARWLLGGLIAGLAASGLYSQTTRLPGKGAGDAQ